MPNSLPPESAWCLSSQRRRRIKRFITRNVFLNSLTLQVAVALVVGSLLSSRFKYHAKLFIILLMSFLVLVVPIPLFLFKPRWPLNALVPGIVACTIIKLFGVEYEIRGQQNINVRNGGVVLLNHQSAIDIVSIAFKIGCKANAFCPFLLPFASAITVATRVPQHSTRGEEGTVLRAPVRNCIPSRRGCFYRSENTASAKDVMKREAVAITKDHLKLAIFPEGTRHDNDTLLPFKKGSFHVAVDSQSIIQPVVVSKYHFLDHKRKRFGRGRVIINILPEIPTKGMAKADVNELTDRCQKLMQAEFDKLSAEAKQYCHN
ncbi:AGAP009414-PA-like protein [Anopheles sinensis]|uniref:1-acylglycerol-3-phosphate O-acyltransferase n=1 Tax=Anopheles sinensis TaxID=74873 RepID=A0A084VPW4_ANOSI|nr:AGAP009414-PA-like protein [Anopheles sinensis]